MIREFPSNLPKLGPREYVQGGTIFNGILDACDEVFGTDWLADARISSFKLEREAVANGRIVVADEAVSGVDPNATFVATAMGQQLRGYFIDEGLPFAREPYDEDSFNRPIEIGRNLCGTFLLPAGRPRADFMKGIVGANKKLHQQTDLFGSELTRIQFLYLRGLDAICLRQRSEDLHIAFVNLSIKEEDEQAWSINQVDVAGTSFRSSFRICYRAAKTA